MNHGPMKFTPRRNRTVEARFWEKVKRGPGCWTWIAARNHHGYGQLGVQGRRRMAHRVSWELANGPLLSGQQVLHRCDNPSCVRTDHLFVGTAVDNMRDCVDKGRFKFCRPRFGVENNLAKLTDAAVVELRRRYSQGETLSSLSRFYGMARASLRRIVNGDGWRHVT